MLINRFKDVELIEGHACPDYIHMLLEIPPKYSISEFMGQLKSKSTLMIFDRHANLKYKFGNRHFWAKGYFVSLCRYRHNCFSGISRYSRKKRKNDKGIYTKSIVGRQDI